MTTPELIYHITAQSVWQSLQRLGSYSPGSLCSEGFIHCCMREQIAAVLERHFSGREGLIVLTVDVRKLDAEVRVEDLYGHGAYPHLYGVLPLRAIVSADALEAFEGGSAPR